MRYANAYLGLLLVVAGCAREPPTVLSLSAETSNPAAVVATRDILKSRFSEFLPSPLSSVHSNIEGSRIIFTFQNGAPSPIDLEYLFATRGRLVVSHRTDTGQGAVWFTDEDIEDAAARLSGEKMFVVVRLKEDAGERVSRASSRSIGEVVEVTLDGTPILEAVVSGVLGRSFQFTAPDPNRAVALAVILKSGHLPAKVVEEHNGA